MSAFVYTIPARKDVPYYKFKITLAKTSYTLNFRFNGRMNRWILDINDVANNQIMSGIPILILRNLFNQYPELNLPNGIIFATDDTGKDTQPTMYSFGLDHTLWFVDESQ
jgi:hypothetical protein